jgi:hypothetical protein
MNGAPPPQEPNEGLVCAILAEQVAALRAGMDGTATFDLLWRTTSLLSWLSCLVKDLQGLAGPAHAELARERDKALTEVAEVKAALDALAFAQAQRQDFARQIADCVVVALERMAVAEMPAGTRFSSGDLAELYVSEQQRALHDKVLQRLRERQPAAAEPAAPAPTPEAVAEAPQDDGW